MYNKGHMTQGNSFLLGFPFFLVEDSIPVTSLWMVESRVSGISYTWISVSIYNWKTHQIRFGSSLFECGLISFWYIWCLYYISQQIQVLLYAIIQLCYSSIFTENLVDWSWPPLQPPIKFPSVRKDRTESTPKEPQPPSLPPPSSPSSMTDPSPPTSHHAHTEL